jgi:hypothetical protein
VRRPPLPACAVRSPMTLSIRLTIRTYSEAASNLTPQRAKWHLTEVVVLANDGFAPQKRSFEVTAWVLDDHD